MESKKLVQSKTLWINLAMSILAFFPSIGVSQDTLLVIFPVVNIILRAISQGKIELI